MKVGIVTIFGDNYGNKLQNYALQTLLTHMGHDVSTIIVHDGERLHRIEDRKAVLGKFSPMHISQVFSSRFKNKYPYKNQRDGIHASILRGRSDQPTKLITKRAEAFSVFMGKHLKVDPLVYKPGDYSYPDKYDAYICGSDQIWNPTYTSTSSAYFLQFVPEGKRIAFAPSFGLKTLPEEMKPLYKNWLEDIPFLSVREEAGAHIIRDLTGRDVPVLPDPTLCLSSTEWESIECKPAFVDGDFVLTYFLGNETNRYRKYVESAAKGLHIINLFDILEPESYTADPAEFVWLVHHAKAMFTDSFHGTVFSLIFHIPFVVFDRVESGGGGMSSRIETLLKMSGLESRRFGTVPSDQMFELDFSEADPAIEKQVTGAKQFLKNALYGIKDTAMESSPFVQLHREDCSGCTACVNVCPVHCITMQVDSEGFQYPRIDADKCVHCHRCTDVCSRAKAEKESGSEHCYVAYSCNESLRMASSSGGMFGEIAKWILSRSGQVYGAGFTEDFRVMHQCARTEEDLSSLRGSKYVQSDLGHCFPEIQGKLETGENVLFSGTPCQVNGLLAYLGKDYANLYTMDIICHGVPSSSVWREYLKMHGDDVKAVSFRDKTYSWHYFSMRIESEKGRYVKRFDEDVYTRLFLENITLRPSCYACAYKHAHRKADFTVADCWGSTEGLKDEDKGISMVFVNTDKGQKLFDQLQLTAKEIPYETAAKKQGAMTRSVPYNQNRELFYSLVEEKGMDEALRGWYGWEALTLARKRLNYQKYRLRGMIKR